MENNRSHTYLVFITIIITLTISNLAVLFRLISRRFQKLALLADDWLIVVADIFVTANALGTLLPSTYDGDGKLVSTVSPAHISDYLKTIYISAQLYGVSVTAIKLSVLMFYRRIFSTASFRRKIIVAGIFVILWFLVNNLIGAFQCTPIRRAWEPLLPGHCINFLKFFIGIQVPNIVLDMIILALPLSAVWQLQMSTPQKVGVGGIFLLGGLSIIIAIVRLAVLITRIGKPDLTSSTAIGDWSIVEPAIEVLSACLPTMTPVLRLGKHWQQLRSSFRSRGSQGKLLPPKDESNGGPFSRLKPAQRSGFQYMPNTESGTATQSSAYSVPPSQREEPDGVFPYSIMVKQDLELTERNKLASI